MKVLELYSGIGGMHYALLESGIKGEVVASVDINTLANDVYRHNFPNCTNMNRNVQSIGAEEIRALNVDAILMSPPCQPFTRVGLQKDTSDNRSSSLFHVLAIVPELKTLKYILLENVKGFENSQTREALLECLRNCDFNYKELILSPCQFGVPNTRHRYYLLAKRKGLAFCFDSPSLEHDLPERLRKLLLRAKHSVLVEKDHSTLSDNDRRCYALKHILENDSELPSIPKKVLRKRAWILDIRNAESSGSCCFTKAYSHYAEGTGSVYCPFPKEIVEKKFSECKEYEKHSEEEFQILHDLKLRYFTPKEVSRLMCFPEDFSFPNSTTDKQKYRLLGNSINVHVVSRLIYLLYMDKEIHEGQDN